MKSNIKTVAIYQTMESKEICRDHDFNYIPRRGDMLYWLNAI